MSRHGLGWLGRAVHTALSDQGDPSTYTLRGAYYLKGRGSRPKVWYLVAARDGSCCVLADRWADAVG